MKGGVYNLGVQVVGRFIILKELGRGGAGIVYLVEDENDGKKYALKLFYSRDRDILEKLEKEFNLVRELNHPGIVKVYEYGIFEGSPFLLMEYVEGSPLSEVGEELTIEEKIKIARKIIEAVAYAHKKGVVHRDLKPENVLITKNGEVKLTDFGIAALHDKTLSKTGGIKGTPAYMAPEEIKGETPGFSSDIFSLGCLLYELFSGISPFKKDTLSATLYAILDKEVESLSSVLPDIPDGISRIISRCLLKNRDLRYKNAVELLSDWNSYQNVKVRLPLSRKKKYLIGVLSGIFLFFISSLIFYFYRDNEPRRVKISGQEISVFNRGGRRLFKFIAGSDISSYLLADFTGDGHKEVFVGTDFVIYRDGKSLPGKDTGCVYYLDRKGKVLWKKRIASDNIYGKEPFYVVDKIYQDTTPGEQGIIVFARNGKWFPYAIKKFFPENSTQANYTFWHSGWVYDALMYDVDHDGVKDIVAAAVNNDMGFKPVIFALSGKFFECQSPPWMGNYLSEESGLLFYTVLPGNGKPDAISLRGEDFVVHVCGGGSFVVSSEGVMKDYAGQKIKEEQRILREQERLLSVLKVVMEMHKNGNDAEALKILKKELVPPFEYSERLYPLLAYMYLLSGTFKFYSGMYEEAFSDLRQASNLDRMYQAPYFRAGQLYLKRSNYRMAALNFSRAYALSSDQWAFFYQVLCEALSGDYRKAVSHLRSYMKKKDAFWREFAGMVFYLYGDLDSAEYYLRTAIDLYPDLEDAKLYLNIIAIDRILLEGRGNSPDIKYFASDNSDDVKGSIAFIRGEYDTALTHLLRAEEDFKKFLHYPDVNLRLSRTYFYLYLLNMQKGKRKEALSYLRKANCYGICKKLRDKYGISCK